MRILLLVVQLTVLSPVVLAAQSLQGVWKLVETVISGGPNAGRHTSDIQPGLLIFTNDHYSVLAVHGFTPRPHLSENPTHDELGRVFSAITAQAGVYQVGDSTLTVTPIVAKSPAVMDGRTFTHRLRVRGDSIWFPSTSSDGIQTTHKWVRVERPRGM